MASYLVTLRSPNININATEFKLILNFKLDFETNAWNGPNLYTFVLQRSPTGLHTAVVVV